jgi:hypothetical protein
MCAGSVQMLLCFTYGTEHLQIWVCDSLGVPVPIAYDAKEQNDHISRGKTASENAKKVWSRKQISSQKYEWVQEGQLGGEPGFK